MHRGSGVIRGLAVNTIYGSLQIICIRYIFITYKKMIKNAKNV